MEEELWRRHHGGENMEEESGGIRGYLGGIWRESGRHLGTSGGSKGYLGGIWEGIWKQLVASGSIWKHLEASGGILEAL